MSETCTYARFWKCALQVNPAGYIAYRGQEHGLSEDEYNKQLLQICLDNDIKVVGLAGHGNVDSVDAMRNTLSEKGVVVFPGFEIASTEKTHFVCLFAENTIKTELDRYLGNLDLTDPGEGVRPSGLGAAELLKRVHNLGGFCYAAHVTLNKGVLNSKLNHIWTSVLLKAAQISGPVNDLPDNYRSIVLNKNSDYKREKLIALINAKDVAKPDDLLDPKASCLIKMTRPCFASFKMAFLDPDSRVRLNSDISEEYYSRLEGIRFNGGYLDEIDIRFSEHLNTVIGGRGTGKSTLLECIRYVLDKAPTGKNARKQHDEILKENLGKEKGRIELVVRSSRRNGKRFIVSRRYGEPPIVRDAGGAVSNFTPADLLPNIEIYGQNEIYEIARNAETQLTLIDRFLPIELADTQAKLGDVEKKLRDNKDRLLRARDALADDEEQMRQLPKMEEEARQYKELGLEDKLKQVPLLEREKQLSDRARNELTRVKDAMEALKDGLPDTAFLSDATIESLPHREQLTALKTNLDALKTESLRLLEDLGKQLVKAEEAQTKGFQKLHQDITKDEEEIQEAFKKLPSSEGRSGREIGTAYQELLRGIEKVRPLKTRIETKKNLVRQLKKERGNLLADLSDIRAQRTGELQKAVKKLNRRLTGKLRLTIVPEGDRGALKRFLLDCDLEGIGEKRLAWVDTAEDLTPVTLVHRIRDGKDVLLKEPWGCTPVVADALIRLSPAQLLDMEMLTLPDTISIDLNVSHVGETFRALDKLSTGQQCTAILHLLLLENPDPLIMDQPEDNLDNAFIAERIVTELRASKIHRQFLFATHNANIPVFGDAEWIGILSSTNEGATLPDQFQGSIDLAELRDKAAEILEGGRSAFIQRKEIYGY